MATSPLPSVTPTTAEVRAGYVDTTQLHPGLFGRPLMLDRIFKLLVTMIDSLQKCAAAQANRLNFLSKWQKAYSDKMNQIHSFVALNGDGIDIKDGKKIDDPKEEYSNKARTDLNNVNTSYTQAMQGNRQVVSDDAKALQTNVNQTNDAVQAQTDMATSILQQMSTILSSLYSG